jgi:hypothetical protein
MTVFFGGVAFETYCSTTSGPQYLYTLFDVLCARTQLTVIVPVLVNIVGPFNIMEFGTKAGFVS